MIPLADPQTLDCVFQLNEEASFEALASISKKPWFRDGWLADLHYTC